MVFSYDNRKFIRNFINKKIYFDDLFQEFILYTPKNKLIYPKLISMNIHLDKYMLNLYPEFDEIQTYIDNHISKQSSSYNLKLKKICHKYIVSIINGIYIIYEEQGLWLQSFCK